MTSLSHYLAEQREWDSCPEIEGIVNRKHGQGMYCPLYLGRRQFGKQMIVDLGRVKNLMIVGEDENNKETFIERIFSSLEKSIISEELNILEIGGSEKIQLSTKKRIVPPSEAWVPLSLLEIEIGKRLASREIMGDAPIFPPWVVIIHELSDLVSHHPQDRLENLLVDLFQSGQEIGIHMISCTSAPSLDFLSPRLLAISRSKLVGQLSDETMSKLLIRGKEAVFLDEDEAFLYLQNQSELVRFKI